MDGGAVRRRGLGHALRSGFRHGAAFVALSLASAAQQSADETRSAWDVWLDGEVARVATLDEPEARAFAWRRHARDLFLQGRFEVALELFDRALEGLTESPGTWSWLAVERAECLLRLGRRAEAWQVFEVVARRVELDSATPVGEAELCFQLLSLAGQLAKAEGLYVDAAEWFDRELVLAHELYADSGDPRALQTAHLHQSQLGLARGDFEGVIAAVEGWLAEGDLHPPGSTTWAELTHNLAWAHGRLEEQDPARTQRAMALFTSVVASDPPAHLAGETLHAMVRRHLFDGRAEEAGALLALMREREELWPLVASAGHLVLETRVALRTGADEVRRQRLRERVAEELEQWIRQRLAEDLAEAGRGLFHLQQPRSLLNAALALELAAEPEGWSALQSLAEVQQATTLARALAAPLPDVRALAASLAPGHGLLVITPNVTDGALVFAVDQDGVSVGRARRYWDVERARGDWLAVLALEDGADPAVQARERRLAAACADALLPDVVRPVLAGWRAVTVVGLDGIGSLPMAWLPLAEDDVLGLSRAVDHWPSLPVGALLSGADVDSAAVVGGAELLLVGDTRPGPELSARFREPPPLGLPEDDRQRLEQSYPPGSVELLIGEDATVSGLRAALERGPRVLQFLVHGVLDRRARRPAGLLLHGDADGWLDAEAIASLAGPPLVLLTGCRTGVAPERRGDGGSADLAGGFLRVGSRCVVAADDELTWRAAIDVSADLHRALRTEGLAPAAALATVRRGLHDRLGGRAPFVDGRLRVIGAGQTALFEARVPDRRSPTWLPWLAGLVGLVGLGLLLRWGRPRRPA